MSVPSSEPPPLPELSVLPGRLSVCRLPAGAQAPDWAGCDRLLSITRTATELSIVCAEPFVPPEIKAERGWRALQVAGPMDFALVGVLAKILQPIAAAGVSVFTLSTFDTDYVLVKEIDLDRTMAALETAGYIVRREMD